MEKVTGIGGIFFKANDRAKLAAWYREHLGVDVQAWGGAAFEWKDGAAPDGFGWAMDPEGNRIELWEPK